MNFRRTSSTIEPWRHDVPRLSKTGILVRDDVREALSKGDSLDTAERTIDITTTGRRSGEPRRIEICFYRFEESTYLSGIPGPRTRDWLLNLIDEPRFIFHLKNGVVADLPAVATVIVDPVERRRVFIDFVDHFNRGHGLDSPWPRASLDEWVEHSPLAKVSFADDD
jgi:F420H(2)-dependent quinone reductase